MASVNGAGRNGQNAQATEQPNFDPTNYEPREMAEIADLLYVTDGEPGYTRKRKGRGFTFCDAEGNTLQDAEVRAYIKSLVIPPAWTEVWICPQPHGHILATGRDEAGRKQYIYHPRWEEMRTQVKHGVLRAFGEALPALRKRVEADLRKRAFGREKVTALVVRLMEETLIRIGNDEYARNNDSYGLTTLLDDHVQFDKSTVVFEFRGKSGKEHEIALRDPRLARLVRACQELPGQRLFQYRDDDGELHTLTSTDVNTYLREITGAGFTSKDFRTWGGTVLAARLLHERGQAESATAQKRIVTEVVKQAAVVLGNTPAVCRSHYIHPTIFLAYETGRLGDYYRRAARQKELAASLSPDEIAVLLTLREESPLPNGKDEQAIEQEIEPEAQAR